MIIQLKSFTNDAASRTKGLQLKTKLEHAIKAVSYTHLDVYKRQVLDASYTKDIEKQDLGNAQKRIDYINSLDKKAILGEIVTNKEGKAALMLDKYSKKNGFVVIQTMGADGYDLMGIYYSKDHDPKTEKGQDVYEIEASRCV